MTPSLDTSIIKCPNCQTKIKLTDAVAGPMLESAKAQFAADLDRERRQAKEAGRKEGSEETLNLKLQLSDLNLKLTDAQTAQALAVRKEKEIADRERELELTIARRVTAESDAIRSKAQTDAAEDARLKVEAKDQQIAGMLRQIEELKTRGEQGNVYFQGEAQEAILETSLRAAYPTDTIAPVSKGQFGGDCLQTVIGPSGVAGTVLWESKRTKVFQAGWLVKLREDQRAAKADVAVLVTQTMPNGMTEEFGLVDGVWVVQWKHAVPFVAALRQSVIAISAALTANEGMETKAKTVYRYLTGPRFKQHVQAIIEKQGALLASLQKERAAMTRIWAEREGLINGVITTTAQMYGDLSSIAGKGLAEVEGLKLQAGE